VCGVALNFDKTWVQGIADDNIPDHFETKSIGAYYLDGKFTIGTHKDIRNTQRKNLINIVGLEIAQIKTR
jgi:hypothetical protein